MKYSDIIIPFGQENNQAVELIVMHLMLKMSGWKMQSWQAKMEMGSTYLDFTLYDFDLLYMQPNFNLGIVPLEDPTYQECEQLVYQVISMEDPTEGCIKNTKILERFSSIILDRSHESKQLLLIVPSEPN